MTASSPTISALFKEWTALVSKAAKAPTEDADADAMITQVDDIQKRLLALPVRSASDLAAKVVASTANGNFGISSTVLNECEALASIDGASVADRLSIHAAAHGATPPKTVIGADGAPSAELLAYCKAHALSLDWVFPVDRHESLAEALTALRKAREAQEAAVDHLGRIESQSGIRCADAKAFDDGPVSAIHEWVSLAENAVLAIPAKTQTEALLKVAALCSEGMDAEVFDGLRAEAKRLVDLCEERG